MITVEKTSSQFSKAKHSFFIFSGLTAGKGCGLTVMFCTPLLAPERSFEHSQVCHSTVTLGLKHSTSPPFNQFCLSEHFK